ncbi:2-hydroxyhepta-2,4-diene-1,7-dioate isomerase [Pandoraea commovens]|uniref:2-hydroxyhepta-2,4-diene-1,7-dioate isomerase n=2 Tax=Pandoraea commovens TaxID=2508289 RepID=A0A5E4XF37_9BURK|nr:2-hydroxyhepta-2,4-diene-1,7-dioate isomerase [Pandoraea commovens]
MANVAVLPGRYRNGKRMKLWTRFKTSHGRIGFGLLQGDQILEHRGDLYDQPVATGATIARDAVELLCPCEPSKIVALWNNYHALGAKLGKAAPSHPLFLIKPATTLNGPDAVIRRPASYAGKIVFEGELGIVIGKQASNVSEEVARDYILGYTLVNDVTAAEIIEQDGNFAQWTRAKGFDTFGCLGPFIAEDFDWREAELVTTLDGTERQRYPLADMIFNPWQLVARLSQDMTLLPGDVIAVGTSIGVGSMKEGALVEVSIDGLGTLANRMGG